MLFFILVFCCDGWGLFPVNPRGKAIPVFGVFIFLWPGFSAFQFLIVLDNSLQAALVGYESLLLIIAFVSAAWNVNAVHRRIKGHLLVIKNAGIAPKTTPVYETLCLYRLIVLLSLVAFPTFFAFNAWQLLTMTPVWILWLVENLIQAIVIGIMLFVCRPRGATANKLLKADPPVKREGIEHVFLEDLETFIINDQDGDLKEWKEGMELPPERPICFDSPNQMKSERDDLRAPFALELEMDGK
jgi:hypothetical protein